MIQIYTFMQKRVRIQHQSKVYLFQKHPQDSYYNTYDTFWNVVSHEPGTSKEMRNVWIQAEVNRNARMYRSTYEKPIGISPLYSSW